MCCCLFALEMYPNVILECSHMRIWYSKQYIIWGREEGRECSSMDSSACVCFMFPQSHYSDGFMCCIQESSEIHSRLDQLSSTPVFNAYSFSIALIISFTIRSNFCGEKYSYYTVTQISAIPERKRLRCLKCWSSFLQVSQLSWQIPA